MRIGSQRRAPSDVQAPALVSRQLPGILRWLLLERRSQWLFC